MESEAFLLRLSRLESDMAEHAEDDKRAFKYSHHMLEDLGAKIAGIERTGARFEADLTHRTGRDSETSASLKEIFDRLRTLERMAWIAIGSTTAFGALVTYFGKGIISLLNK